MFFSQNKVRVVSQNECPLQNCISNQKIQQKYFCQNIFWIKDFFDHLENKKCSEHSTLKKTSLQNL